MKSFEDLACWQKIAALRKKLSQLVKTFPPEERYRLVDQIVRASRSATANIAEGYVFKKISNFADTAGVHFMN